MTDFGMTGAPGGVHDGGLDEHIHDDPSMAACCLKEMENERKTSELLRKLRAVDRTRIAEDRVRGVFAQQATTQSNHVHEHDGCCGHDHHTQPSAVAPVSATEQGEDEEDDDLDYDTEEELEQLRLLRLSKLREQHSNEDQQGNLKEQGAPSVQENVHQGVVTQSQFDGISRTLAPDVDWVVCVCFSAASRDTLADSVVKEVRSMSCVRGKCAYLLLDMDRVEPKLKTFMHQSNTQMQSLPFVSVIDRELHPTGSLVITTAQLGDICRSTGPWLASFLSARGVSPAQIERGHFDEEDQQDETPKQYCNKPGCGRTFAHEHVQRTRKYSGSDDGYV